MSRVKGQIEVLKLAQIRPRLLNLQDAARYVGLSPQTLYNRDKNNFPVRPVYRGGRPLFLIEELDEHIDSLPRKPVYNQNNDPKKE